MIKKITLLLTLLCLALLVVSCTNETVTNQEQETEQPANEDTVTATGEVYNVIVENSQFMPTNLEIKLGDAIEWSNSDSKDHTVTFENGDFDTNLPVGAKASYVFKESGEYRYFCQFHPGMMGTVIVS